MVDPLSGCDVDSEIPNSWILLGIAGFFGWNILMQSSKQVSTTVHGIEPGPEPSSEPADGEEAKERSVADADAEFRPTRRKKMVFRIPFRKEIWMSIVGSVILLLAVYYYTRKRRNTPAKTRNHKFLAGAASPWDMV